MDKHVYIPDKWDLIAGKLAREGKLPTLKVIRSRFEKLGYSVLTNQPEPVWRSKILPYVTAPSNSGGSWGGYNDKKSLYAHLIRVEEIRSWQMEVQDA